jgi:hypothetical protein
VPGYGDQTTYRTTLSLRDIERAAQRHGRTIARTYDVSDSIKSLLLERGP